MVDRSDLRLNPGASLDPPAHGPMRPQRADGAAKVRRQGIRVPYAELHCHSNFSFLDGASHPEELVDEAVRLGLDALALTDHGGLYGIVRFAEAARRVGMPTVIGTELTLSPGSSPRTGVPDPAGRHLVVLARDRTGYALLSRAISHAHLEGGAKGAPRMTVEDLATWHEEAGSGHWLVLTGCRKGPVPAAVVTAGPAVAARRLAELVEAFGRDNVAVELWDHGDPVDTARNDALALLATQAGVAIVATNNVHYATPSCHPLATTLAAIRSRRTLDGMEGWLPPAPTAHLRSGAEQKRRFARWSGAVEQAAALGRACAFDLRLVAPGLPNFPVPPGHDEQTWLAELVRRGATKRYGPRGAERVRGAWAQIDHELTVVAKLGFAGYFLVVWDIVEFCRGHGIYCQGRGSAANSAVCYALGITRADAVALGLLFERFLSPERDGPPDIDLDIESSRREEVIGYVYERYGRLHAAQVANVITYRPRSAIRDLGKVLGHPDDEIDAWTKSVERGEKPGTGLPAPIGPLVAGIAGYPRHLGLHSGGMVICDRPVVEVCPVEWARQPGRSVLQWDKESCAAVGLVKFDLLGLGMLDALHRAVDLVAAAHGVDVDLAELEQEDAVYDMLCRADTIGVFQVESRAQMATLPRLQPRRFSDLVIEVALIRPGPIQGGSVHPYLRRREGQEPARAPHPLLERALGKTLGVPLFQEQLMQMAIDAAGFSPDESDELRQAMSAKRSGARMEMLRERLLCGMEERGITGEVAEEIYAKLSAFASFGFPESHAVSFAYFVYASAWLKLHYPAAFCAALVNAQPMGFWSPQTLVSDAQRHAVEVRHVDVRHSGTQATLEWPPGQSPESGTQPAVRLGLSSVRSISAEAADGIVAQRPYRSIEDLVRRTGLGRAQLEALATAGALDGLPGRAGGTGKGSPGHTGTAGSDPEAARGHGGARRDLSVRRRRLWAAVPLAQAGAERLPGVILGDAPPELPEVTPLEGVAADLWATGICTGPGAMELARPHLSTMGIVPAAALGDIPHGQKVLVAGVVTHRQHPATAKGTVFFSLEDESGLVNVICSPGAWIRWRHVARSAPALVVKGRVEHAGRAATGGVAAGGTSTAGGRSSTGGGTNVVAERFSLLDFGDAVPSQSRDSR